MQKTIDALKKNKRIVFSIIAIVVAAANMFGFADFQLDPNIAIVVVSGVTLVLSLLRKYYDV